MLTRCPNCQSLMNTGDACPECDHRDDDPDCPCAYCDGSTDPDDGGAPVPAKPMPALPAGSAAAEPEATRGER